MESPFIKTGSGAVTIILTAAAATMLALAIAAFFPALIPTSAGSVRL